MKDEIKEILDYFRKYATIREYPMINKIEDYITNLQEENEKLKSSLKDRLKYSDELDDYISRIDKAVEFIRMHDLYHPTNEFRLLCILKGEDE